MSGAATFSPSKQPTNAAGNPYLLPVGLAAVMIASLYLFSPNFRAAPSTAAGPYAGDFLQEWLGGYLVDTGQTDRLYDATYVQALQHDENLIGFHFDDNQYLPIVYPPFYYQLTSPLSRLPVRTAAWVWAALMTGCFAATAVLLGRTSTFRQARDSTFSPGRQTGRTGVAAWAKHTGVAAWAKRDVTGLAAGAKRGWEHIVPWALPAAALYMPLLESLSSSQKGTLCLLILTATFVLLNGKRPVTAGIVFGLLAFKPQLTLVIAAAMLLKGQWRFIFGATITGAVLLATSLAVGTEACLDYLRFSTGAADYVQTAGYDLHKSHCLHGFFTLLFGSSALPARLLTLAAVAGVVYLLVRLMRGPLVWDSGSFAVQFSGLVVATVLLSPHLFTYDLTILLLPMFLLATRLAAGQPESKVQRKRLLWLLVLLYALPGVSVGIAAATGVQFTVPVMAALLFVLSRKRRQAAVTVRGTGSG